VATGPLCQTESGSSGRSLKYHRPRGLYSLDGECSNFHDGRWTGVPNVRAETTLLTSGDDGQAPERQGSRSST